MQMPHPQMDHNNHMPHPQMEHMPPPQSWGPPPQAFPPNVGGGLGYGGNPHYMPPPRQVENYYPQVEMPPPPEKQPHQGISAYGREAPMNVHASSNSQTPPSMITQVFSSSVLTPSIFNLEKLIIKMFNQWK